ncbi:type II toxin-antitoxin system VapC family toxin [Agromyces sp. H66]|uniref:type II toxin-antitoxin system VapC family toxin n=1 Tax=Agromyces sp. H66 TaxID=2529859 RepID=UPI0010AA6C96|nr:type II toxin-antitoxin system VapC family toxin [Agromyces sp. H66]
MSFVLDASVTLAWCFEDESTVETDELLTRLRTDSAIAPSIWVFEIANALTVAQRRRRLVEAKAVLFASTLRSLPIEVAPAPSMASILAVASAHKLSAYDAAYLELAERTGMPLATLDERLRAAAGAAGVQALPD